MKRYIVISMTKSEIQQHVDTAAEEAKHGLGKEFKKSELKMSDSECKVFAENFATVYTECNHEEQQLCVEHNIAVGVLHSKGLITAEELQELEYEV